MEEIWVFEEKLGYAIDTVELAKKAIQTVATQNIPPSYSLSTLYQYVTGTNMESAHQAMEDVNATISNICHFGMFRSLACLDFKPFQQFEQFKRMHIDMIWIQIQAWERKSNKQLQNKQMMQKKMNH